MENTDEWQVELLKVIKNADEKLKCEMIWQTWNKGKPNSQKI
jgi:hypothetical protein